MGIGKRLRIRREQLGYTQKQLGEKVGVTPSAITNYENETSHPKEPILIKLMEALKCDANYLYQDSINITNDCNSLNNDSKNSELLSKSKKLLNDFNALSEAGQDVVLDFLKYQLYAEQGFFDEERFYHDVQEIVDDRMQSSGTDGHDKKTD